VWAAAFTRRLAKGREKAEDSDSREGIYQGRSRRGSRYLRRPTGREFIDSELIADSLEPRIHALRLRFFGKKDPLFPSSEKVNIADIGKIGEQIHQWLKVRAIRPESKPEPDEGRVIALTTELASITGSDISGTMPLIEFPRRNPSTSKLESFSVLVPSDSPISELARELAKMKEAAGFSANSLTFWFFTGSVPSFRESVRSHAFRGQRACRLVISSTSPLMPLT
jgi:hypothetical protein